MSAIKNTAPAEAPSAAVIIAAARELAPAVEKLLGGINALLDSQHPAPPEPQETAAQGAEQGHPHDRTGNRLRAYLASIRSLRGCIWRDDIEEANARGRSLIERLALSAEGTGLPKLRLSAADVADVLSFVHCSEPVDPLNWYREPQAGPSHICGLTMLLQALETSLRSGRGDGPNADDETRSPPMDLAAKCARAKALMEEAQQIVDQVLVDPAYRPGVLPPGVVPSGVDDYLRDAIAMLEPAEGGDAS